MLRPVFLNNKIKGLAIVTLLFFYYDVHFLIFITRDINTNEHKLKNNWLITVI